MSDTPDASLEADDLSPDPMGQFRRWYEDAESEGIHLVNAIALGTAGADGRPAVRHVLLRGFDDRGFVFYTNLESRKARHMDEHPWAAFALLWKELDRQVCVTGAVERTTDAESDAYFASRPREARIGAWSSRQSTVLASRDELMARFVEFDARYPGNDVPRPPFWGGYRIVPDTVEFWQARAYRLHDRFRYTMIRASRRGGGWSGSRRNAAVRFAPMSTDDLRARIAADMPRTIADLERLVRIPSKGYAGDDPAHVRASAEATRDVFRAAGVSSARLLELDGGHPAVFGEIDGPTGAPTILLYAHHDVQPEGPLDQWDSPPFEPEVRDGRLYGRGSADDKAGVVIHAAALRALGDDIPVTVKVLVEGEEECSTAHLPELVQGNAELLRADVAVICDAGNYRTGVPTITTSIRGVTDCVVQVRVLDQAQHSGSFGGAIPDAITALARIISTLHDDDGNVTIPGLRRFTWEGAAYPEEELLDEAGAVAGLRTIGTGAIADRVWAGPAVAVLGIDAPAIVGSSNQVVPVARARVSLRLAPGDDAVAATETLMAFLKDAAPWGVEVSVEGGAFDAGQGYMVDTASPALLAAREALQEAYGVEVIETGSGGSIPLVPMLDATFPGIAVLLLGAADERSNTHSVNESVDLSELEHMALAEALFMRRLAALA